MYPMPAIMLKGLVFRLQTQKDRQPNTDGLLAGVEGFEPSARGFGDRCSTN